MVIYVDNTHGKQFLVALQSGIIPLDQDAISNTLCLGSTCPTSEFMRSHATEEYAQAMASLFILQHVPAVHIGLSPSTPLYIVYDCTSAHATSIAQCKWLKVSAYAQFAFALDVHCSTLGYKLNHHHVHSHKGQPWNELVDSICTYTMKQFPIVGNFVFGPLSDVQIWEIELATTLSVPYIQDRLMCDSLPSHRLCLPDKLVCSRIDQRFDGPPDGVVLRNVSVVQYNVNSLKKHTIREALSHLTVHNEVNFLIMQESRSPKPTKYIDENGLIICSSAALKGAYGCSIWINPKIPLLHHKSRPVFPTFDSVSIIHSARFYGFQ